MFAAPRRGTRPFLLSLLLTALVGLVSVVLPPAVAVAAPQILGSSLAAGAALMPGQSLQSPLGNYRLDMQTDGNLVLGNAACAPGSPGCPSPLWALGTWGQPGNHLIMQTDGNLVLYSRTGRAVWATQTWGAGHVFQVQEDTNLVVYAGARAVWSTGYARSYAHIPDRDVGDLTSTNGRYRFGTPGNSMDTWDLRLPGRTMWGVNCLHDPRVNCEVTGRLVLQGDGNLVWYQPGIHGGQVAEWSTGTWGMGPTNYLVMQDDGNLVLYSLWHQALWNSMGFPVVHVH